MIGQLNSAVTVQASYWSLVTMLASHWSLVTWLASYWSTVTMLASNGLVVTSSNKSQTKIASDWSVMTSSDWLIPGKYPCRVDFRASPTVTSSQELEVVEQSSKPVVITDEGVEVMGSVGPYLLGQSLILVTVSVT